MNYITIFVELNSKIRAIPILTRGIKMLSCGTASVCAGCPIQSTRLPKVELV